MAKEICCKQTKFVFLASKEAKIGYNCVPETGNEFGHDDILSHLRGGACCFHLTLHNILLKKFTFWSQILLDSVDYMGPTCPH